MLPQTRRTFTAALAGSAVAKAASEPLDQWLAAAAKQHGIPAAVAMIAGPDRSIASAATGPRDAESGLPCKLDSIFSIASMTKAVTTVAAMQLVEQGKVKLHDPVSPHLPQFEKLQLLEGFDPQGRPRLRPARTHVTLHHLLTHTSGLAYSIWNPDLDRLRTLPSPPPQPLLLTEPGTRWEYGTSCDWAGRLVEKISGQTLEDYFQQHIFTPLDMTDTSFILPPAKFERLMGTYHRESDNKLHPEARTQPKPPTSFNGGGGLYSTAADYTRFMQSLLHRGKGILKPETAALMMHVQTGSLSAGKMKSLRPELSADVDFHPGVDDSFTYGFLTNTKPYPQGRSAGSLAWGGILNTFYWIDPKKKLCATILMQFVPFCDPAAMNLLRSFEHRVYA